LGDKEKGSNEVKLKGEVIRVSVKQIHMRLAARGDQLLN
jgi:hypothetical protein